MFVLLCVVTAAAPLATASLGQAPQAPLTVLWTYHTKPESYVSVALGDDTVVAGTMGLDDCRADVLDAATGKLVTSVPGICRIDATGSVIGGVGYNYPNLTIVVTDQAKGTLWNATESGQVSASGSCVSHPCAFFRFLRPCTRFVRCALGTTVACV